MENLRKNISLFCIFKKDTKNEELGIAAGCFAGDAFANGKSLDSVSGRSFGWVDSEGDNYTDDKRYFSRPSVEYVKENISIELQHYFEKRISK